MKKKRYFSDSVENRKHKANVFQWACVINTIVYSKLSTWH